MAVNPATCKVALLAGGSSGEKDISIASGKGAQEALKEAGIDVTWIDPAKRDDLRKLVDESFDVAFLCMHGKMGEDGTVQGFLEMLGIPYTCSHVQASAIAIDKVKSKILYERAGLKTPASLSFEKGDPCDSTQIAEKLGLPCVVKPATEGSALGVEIVNDIKSLEEAISRVFEIDDQMVIEQFIEGMEITVAILGNEKTKPLPIIQIVPSGDFYDFESKYAPGGSQHICPAPIDPNLTEEIQSYAAKAHRALGCSGVSRSDFIIDANNQAWILETNTIPGMTATSLLPDAARAAGISFPQLCTQLIEFALE